MIEIAICFGVGIWIEFLTALIQWRNRCGSLSISFWILLVVFRCACISGIGLVCTDKQEITSIGWVSGKLLWMVMGMSVILWHLIIPFKWFLELLRRSRLGKRHLSEIDFLAATLIFSLFILVSYSTLLYDLIVIIVSIAVEFNWIGGSIDRFDIAGVILGVFWIWLILVSMKRFAQAMSSF